MRILIAGLGAVGQRHARNLRSLCGPSLELLAYRRRRYPSVITDALQRDDTRNVEDELCVRAFFDLDDALAEKPDAVFVCTPTSEHLSIAQRAADAGAHVFIEKPVSHTLDGLEGFRNTVESRRLVVLIGCQWRFHPCVRRLREIVRDGELGPMIQAEIEYREYLPDWHPYEDYRTSYAARAELGGGVILTQIHDYDLACWLFGTPQEVAATGGHRSHLEIDVEDTVVARLRHDAVSVCVRQTFASRDRCRKIRVVGERGSVTADLLSSSIAADPLVASLPRTWEHDRNQMFLAEARHFLQCIAGQEAPFVPLDDGILALRVALAVKDALRTGQTVKLVPEQEHAS